MHTLRLETVIDAPAADCFELSLSIDAQAASMSRFREQVVGGVTQGQLFLGDSVTWQARHFGITWRMCSVITEYELNQRFVDEQRRGPFHTWWHEHQFHAVTPERTLMIDNVRFQSPVAPVGWAVDQFLLSRYMTRLLENRNHYVKQALEAG